MIMAAEKKDKFQEKEKSQDIFYHGVFNLKDTPIEEKPAAKAEEKQEKPEDKKEDAPKEESKEESPKEDPKPSEDEMMMKDMYKLVKAMHEKMCGTEEKQKAESSDDLSKAASENAILKDELAKAHKAIEDLKNAENKGFTKAITIEKTEDGVVSKSDDGKPKSTLDLIKSIHSNGGKRFGY